MSLTRRRLSAIAIWRCRRPACRALKTRTANCQPLTVPGRSSSDKTVGLAGIQSARHRATNELSSSSSAVSPCDSSGNAGPRRSPERESRRPAVRPRHAVLRPRTCHPHHHCRNASGVVACRGDRAPCLPHAIWRAQGQAGHDEHRILRRCVRQHDRPVWRGNTIRRIDGGDRQVSGLSRRRRIWADVFRQHGLSVGSADQRCDRHSSLAAVYGSQTRKPTPPRSWWHIDRQGAACLSGAPPGAGRGRSNDHPHFRWRELRSG